MKAGGFRPASQSTVTCRNRQRVVFPRQAVQIQVGRREKEMILIAQRSPVRLRFRRHLVALTELDRLAGTDAGTGRRRFAIFPAVGTEIAFHRVMVDRVIAHRAIGTRDHTFTAAGTAVFVDA